MFEATNSLRDQRRGRPQKPEEKKLNSGRSVPLLNFHQFHFEGRMPVKVAFDFAVQLFGKRLAVEIIQCSDHEENLCYQSCAPAKIVTPKFWPFCFRPALVS